MARTSSDQTHTTAAVLAIGDELISGESVDTNSAYVAQRLSAIGVKPIAHQTVGDDLDAIVDAMRSLATRADLVVSTGGLGPTDDDLTRPALAQALGEELVKDADAAATLEKRVGRAGEKLLNANRVQTQRPTSANMIPNKFGTAPGLTAMLRESNNGSGEPHSCEIFCLPGPPGEMKPMFEGFVAPVIRPPVGRVIRVRTLWIFGLPESAIPAMLDGLMERGRNPVVGTAAKSAVIACKIRYAGAASEADSALDQAEQKVRTALDPFVFGSGDETLASCVVELLRAQGQTVATAESCTGGLVGEMLTSHPGSSAVFVGGWVTYTNELKIGELGVNSSAIEAEGAVSEAVAKQMAEGAIEQGARDGALATHALAITGIAGPDGGSPDKPVGTVFIARATTGEETDVRLFRFPDSRNVVRERSALAALGMLRLKLIGRTDVKLLWEQT